MSESEKSLLELVEDELRERLEDDGKRRSIPHYTLAQMHKVLEKSEGPEIPEGESLSMLEVILEAQLPVERKREMLVDELKRVQDYALQVTAALEDADAGKES